MPYSSRFVILACMQRSVETKFWKARTDIQTTDKKIRLNPGSNSVPLTVYPDALPILHYADHKQLSQYLPSMRSRYAQLGIDIEGDIMRRITQAIRLNPDFPDIPLELEAGIVNYSQRPIDLPESIRLFRLFRSFTEPMQGRELVSALRSGQIKINGKQGVAWDLEYPQQEDQPITGVRVAIDSQRTWIPKGRKPIQISDTARNFRKEVDKYHKPIPKTAETILWVGQTPNIQLDPSIEGVLDHVAFPNISRAALPHSFGTHIKSHLIDAGSNWPIRVEILSGTEQEIMPNFVTFYFYKNF